MLNETILDSYVPHIRTFFESAPIASACEIAKITGASFEL